MVVFVHLEKNSKYLETYLHLTIAILMLYRFPKAICSPPCANGGHCMSPGKCECTSQYEGSHCTQGMYQSYDLYVYS